MPQRRPPARDAGQVMADHAKAIRRLQEQASSIPAKVLRGDVASLDVNGLVPEAELPPSVAVQSQVADLELLTWLTMAEP